MNLQRSSQIKTKKYLLVAIAIELLLKFARKQKQKGYVRELPV